MTKISSAAYAVLGVLLVGQPAHGQEVRTMTFVLGKAQDELRVTAEYEDPGTVDKRLTGSRVVPVRLTVKNISSSAVTFNYTDFRLNLAGVVTLEPVDPSKVTDAIRKTARFSKLLGAFASQSSTFHRTETERARLRDGSLKVNEERQGLVYFLRPAGAPPVSANALWLESARYRPQMLETKDIKVYTKPLPATGSLEWLAEKAEWWKAQLFGSDRPFNKSYALLIGIGKYQHLNPLTWSAKDVEKMQAFLQSQGFDEIVSVTDERVTADMIQSPQKYFKSKIERDDRFLFYYSGHGVSFPDGARTRGYLPLVNEVANSHANSIPMDGLVTWMTGLNAKHLLVVLDSCFSGLAIDGIELKGPDATVDGPAFARAAGGPARFLLMAGTSGQRSVAGRSWNGSLFTDSILRGLSTVDRVDIFNNRIITTRGLYVWLKEAVSGESTKVGQPMTPLFKDLALNGASQGDFVFVRVK
jgi:uncharacterized caspase-like protein